MHRVIYTYQACYKQTFQPLSHTFILCHRCHEIAPVDIQFSNFPGGVCPQTSLTGDICGIHTVAALPRYGEHPPEYFSEYATASSCQSLLLGFEFHPLGHVITTSQTRQKKKSLPYLQSTRCSWWCPSLFLRHPSLGWIQERPQTGLSSQPVLHGACPHRHSWCALQNMWPKCPPSTHHFHSWALCVLHFVDNNRSIHCTYLWPRYQGWL